MISAHRSPGDCEIKVGPGTTTLRTEVPDQAALSGLMDRVSRLGLEVIDVSLAAPPRRPGGDQRLGWLTCLRARTWLARG